MTLHLATHAHLAVVGDDVVGLDVSEDSYACWVGAGRRVRMDAVGRVTTDDPEFIDELRDLGYLSARPTERSRSQGAAPPAADLRGRREPAAARRDRSDFVRTAAETAGRFHGRPLGAVLRAASARPGPSGPTDAVVRRALLFARWAPWIPFQGLCLYRAFFLRRYLQRAGLDADWVFGVRTWPFSAHCWLQAGDLVLDDDLDRVRTYVPILTV